MEKGGCPHPLVVPSCNIPPKGSVRVHCHAEGGPLSWGVGLLESEIWEVEMQLVTKLETGHLRVG